MSIHHPKPLGATVPGVRGSSLAVSLPSGERSGLNSLAPAHINLSIRNLVEFALTTAMRRAEMLNARWRDVDFDDRTILITTTKNGHPRTIPLSGRALAILQARRSAMAGDEPIFPTTEDAVKMR
jgi:integrase